MSDFSEWHITEAMIVYGGSFVQLLGRLYRAGDADNKARIIRAWPEYWKEYTDLAMRRETTTKARPPTRL